MIRERPNLNYIDELAGGDQEFQQELIQIIKSEFPLEAREYHICLDKGQLEDAAALVHKIKHKINIFGLSNGYDLAKNHERQLRAGSTESSEKFAELLEHLDKYLEQL
jgi:HPt (histidine-containing phosphotransfer) domain-containing protein